ncbi:MAG: glycosyltransferase family 2 protein [Lachnoclostridium sp.]|nr:glycosyltransferase family 2 protein [Lachnospira sp.]MCM1247768.1 glycosyltransferase family 2 protein [Lachnoclostridium sp.]MCM1534315.1 glycosyltransferase family 2 protein [Clostridium sp.]
MDKITIVIPNYNGKKYLEGCLQALEKERECPETPEFEILVVDNGSADGSAESAAERFPDVKIVFLKENTGFCHAVNVGIRKSQAPYVILLNNDTKVKTGFVKNLYFAIKKRSDIFSVSAKMLMWDNPELIDDAGDYYCALGWAYGRGKGKPACRYEKPAEVFSACAGAAIYRRGIFEKIGLFDENHFAYLEDLDIGYRARIWGYCNFYEPKAEVLHFGSASTGSRYNERKTVLAASNSVYVIAKNMPLLQILCNLPFLSVGFLVKFLFFCKKGMGILYLKGLWKGFRRSVSREGRKCKVPFSSKNLRHYLRIQMELWANLFQLNS